MHDVLAPGIDLPGMAHHRRRRPPPRLERLLAEAVLEPDITPAGGDVGARPQGLRDARRLLVTGASGFLGRWLAKELLLSSDASLVCVVRAGAAAGDAAERLRAALGSTGVDEDTVRARVRVLEGDLSNPFLGMRRSTFESLADTIDAICHAGATVNWVLPYRSLKPANVEATRDLLRLASRRSLPFHFVSSLSVCYSSSASSDMTDDRFDPLAHLDGLHLGYAQSKAVAEALVLEAGRRGLPVTIYRPSLISGHSETGSFNTGDILARLVGGCVRMGTAPDLDWLLDCLPVDTAAHHILEQSHVRGTHHLLHGHPRQWRECVLWMRLSGYEIRLIPYNEWLRQIDRETDGVANRTHPLRPLRPFFLERYGAGRGTTLPEILLASPRTFGPPANHAPPLDAPLLQRYFDAFARERTLPPIPCAVPARDSRPLDAAFFSQSLGAPVASAELMGELSGHSIVSELTAWRSGRNTGLFRYRLMRDGTERDVIVKVKARDRDTIAVGEALARLCDDRVGEAYARFADRMGLVCSHERELAIYRQVDPRFTAHAPALLGWASDTVDGTRTLILEQIANARLKDAADRTGCWTVSDIDRVVEGLATLQAIWYAREPELREMPWIGHVQSARDVLEMSELWRSIASHAAPHFAAWAGRGIESIQQRIVSTAGAWWPALEDQPRTLIHNDFTPRNICLRSDEARASLLAYDWELATLGAPQHDLAELLCFVLPSSATDHEIDVWIERHRVLLERASGRSIGRSDWTAGFRSAVYDLMLNRLPMYALVHRVRRQSFLPRVVRTWRRLYDRFSADRTG
jgi:thioester reductase-like protein